MSTPPSAPALVPQLRQQAAACESLGSSFYGRLLLLAADDADRGGPVAGVLEAYDNRPTDDAISLRLLGSVHRLVLQGRAPALAAHYPNTGGDGDAVAAWPKLLAVVQEHRAAIDDGLTRPPQTNEVGRAAGLIGALHHLVAHRPLPLRLLEIGASGGLNLRADRFRVTTRSSALGAGPVDSALVLHDAWEGHVPPVSGPIDLVERLGCDPAPVDPTTEDGALTLMSYVWPDQAVRWSRLRAALQIARVTPATVVRAAAGDFLSGLAPASGRWTVVWHSVMWQYLDGAERSRVNDHLARAGALATPDAPLARVTLEPYGADFLVTARTWPDLGLTRGPGKGLHEGLVQSRPVMPDGQVVLGLGAAHGVPVRWF